MGSYSMLEVQNISVMYYERRVDYTFCTDQSNRGVKSLRTSRLRFPEMDDAIDGLNIPEYLGMENCTKMSHSIVDSM